ncbi:MAG: efflux RND transporter permease subunit, partial [Desulfovibrionaceae bacterium]|nr:efflux RND transporter permease subunit [Desulfovibrionaceae bacterium]
RSLAGTFIASVAIPFSIIATFAAMFGLGYTLDNLSLMALTLSVGFVVDDAIVMLENIVRHLEMGKTPMRAALDGAREIGFTIISMTLSLAVVFVPIVFMAGIVGRVLHEFAMTIALAILISGAVSLSLSPMLCSRTLKTGSRMAESDRLFNWLLNLYKRSLHLAIDHRGKTMIAAGAVLGLTVWAFMAVPKGFLPTNDIDYFFGFTQARQGISYQAMLDRQIRLEPIFLADPDVIMENQIIGVPLQNQGMTFVMLKPQSERKRGADEVIRDFMPRANSIPGLMCFLVNPPMIQIGGKQAKGDYVFTLQSPDTGVLYSEAKEFLAALAKLPQLSGVNSDLQMANPQVELNVDRDKAASLGISMNDVENALYTAYGERKISTIYAQNDEYKVIMELLPEFQRDARALSMLYVRSDSGKLVRLDAVASFSLGLGPVTVNHTGQLPSVTASFNAGPGVALGEVTKAVSDLAARTLPESVSTQFEGTAGAFQESMNSLYFLLALAIVVIYILLGCLYESFIHPLTILSGLPSAALGGLLTLMAFGYELNLYGYVGVIMLIGIVKKNSIMVVDFAIAAEKEGKTPGEAAFQGSMVRFRPIMMTTLAAIMGAMPIALGFGAGAEARRPLGLVVVGGLVLSQLVTLYLTPVFYTYMDQLQNWLRRKSSAAGHAEEA